MPGFAAAETKSVSGTTTSASATFGAAGTACTDVLVLNPGTTVAFVRFTTGASTAVATDQPVGAGQSVLLSKGIGADTFSAVMASGTATVYASAGWQGR
jgi:hypothetical protein